VRAGDHQIDAGDFHVVAEQPLRIALLDEQAKPVPGIGGKSGGIEERLGILARHRLPAVAHSVLADHPAGHDGVSS
jgi:hypothetical protein